MSLVLFAGLPRSGSTLLLNILAQNPEFDIDLNSGLLQCILHNIQFFKNNPKEKAKIPKTNIKFFLKNIVKSYHNSIDEKNIIDKNRLWPSHINLINQIIGEELKIICCVRNLWEITDSVRKLIDKDILENFDIHQNQIGQVKSMKTWINDALNNPDNQESLIGIYQNLYELFVVNNYSNVLFIDYSDLCLNPEKELQKIYYFLDIKEFRHDFSNVRQVLISNDEEYGFSNELHTIRNEVEKPRIVNKDWIRKLVDEVTFERIDKAKFW